MPIPVWARAPGKPPGRTVVGRACAMPAWLPHLVAGSAAGVVGNAEGGAPAVSEPRRNGVRTGSAGLPRGFFPRVTASIIGAVGRRWEAAAAATSRGRTAGPGPLGLAVTAPVRNAVRGPDSVAAVLVSAAAPAGMSRVAPVDMGRAPPAGPSRARTLEPGTAAGPGAGAAMEGLVVHPGADRVGPLAPPTGPSFQVARARSLGDGAAANRPAAHDPPPPPAEGPWCSMAPAPDARGLAPPAGPSGRSTFLEAEKAPD